MVTIKHKPTVDSEKIKRRKSKHTAVENHQVTKEVNQKRKKETTSEPEKQ